MKRAFIMVLDSFGIGATEDAERFGDVGADTLGHIAEACAKGEADNGRKGPLNLPNHTKVLPVSFRREWTATLKLSARTHGRTKCHPVKTPRLVTGKSPVSRFCLSGDTSPITKTASLKSYWINWSNALICRVTSVTATPPVRSFWISWENRQADFLYLR